MIHQEQQKTLQRAEQAEKALKLARQSADEMIQISEQELAGKPFMEGARKRMLVSALEYYRGLMAQQADDPDAQKDLAAAQEYVNQILADLAVLQGGGRVDLLNRGDVRDDLGLTPEQHDGLQGLLQAMDRERKDGFADFSRLPAEAKQQRLLDDARTHESAVNKILSAQQQQRLKQIALQLQGLSAFHDVDVVTALGLTAPQKQRLQEVETEAFACGPDPGRGPGKGPEQGARAAEKFVAGLTEEQKKCWNTMTGEPFQGRMGPFGPPPDGPHPDGPPHGPDPHGPPPHDRPGPPPDGQGPHAGRS